MRVWCWWMWESNHKRCIWWSSCGRCEYEECEWGGCELVPVPTSTRYSHAYCHLICHLHTTYPVPYFFLIGIGHDRARCRCRLLPSGILSGSFPFISRDTPPILFTTPSRLLVSHHSPTPFFWNYHHYRTFPSPSFPSSFLLSSLSPFNPYFLFSCCLLALI